jgi:Sec-independent protein translocase protein TatA
MDVGSVNNHTRKAGGILRRILVYPELLSCDIPDWARTIRLAVGIFPSCKSGPKKIFEKKRGPYYFQNPFKPKNGLYGQSSYNVGRSLFMEFLGIGPLELLLIILLVLIVFSPKDIAGGGKKVGRVINNLYRSETWKTMRKMSQEIQDLPNQLAREAQLDELRDLNKTLPQAVQPSEGKLPPAASSTPSEKTDAQAEIPAKADSETNPPPIDPAPKE